MKRFVIKGKHNCPISVLQISSKKKAKAIIQIFHGMGEHKERYIPFMEFMSTNGYICVVHDHRKHGESVPSENKHGMFDRNDRWYDVLEDAYQVTRHVQKEFPGLPIILFGHSMGSIIARLYISQNPLIPTATILSGTLPPIYSFKAFIPKLLAGFISIFAPNKRSDFLANLLNKPLLKTYKPTRTSFDWLSRDEDIVDKYIEDPLCGYSYTPQFYKEFFKGIVDCNKSNVIKQTKDRPILFISGQNDPVGEFGEGVKKTMDLYRGHGLTNLTLQLFPEARHEILNEINKEETMTFILNWCNQLFEK